MVEICRRTNFVQENSDLVRVNMAKTDLPDTVAWNEINWRKVEKSVFKLQKRIYQASISNDVQKLRKLQKTLINSYHAKLISVRRVTQDNSGKRTAGVDKIKSLNPKQRLILAQNLKLKDKSQPVRRIWIGFQKLKEKSVLWEYPSCTREHPKLLSKQH